MSEPSSKTPPAIAKPYWVLRDPVTLVSVILSLAAIIWFYAYVGRFNSGRDLSALAWLKSSWNPETDYEHGMLFPFLILGLIIYQFKTLREVAGKGSNLGLVAVFIGVVLYAVS